jgi:hypothetical protein
MLNPATTGATAAGYTNNFAGTTSTTLYVIDTNSDTLNIQNPPNNGTLVAVGALGVDASAVNGFDIARGDNAAFAALTVGGATNLYRINLQTGAATIIGAITGATGGLRGLAASFDNAAAGKRSNVRTRFRRRPPRGFLDFPTERKQLVYFKQLDEQQHLSSRAFRLVGNRHFNAR